MKQLKKVDPVPFTKEGYEKLFAEQTQLKTARLDVLMHLQKARELGDLKENGYYRSYKFKLSDIDRRLRQLAYLIKYGVVTEHAENTVGIGKTVKVTDGKKEREFYIVGGHESNPLEGRLSHISPIGSALVGKNVGDTVAVEVPAGKVNYTIIKIT